MQNALEESRALLETADRQRRSAEQELADTNETLADLGNVNQSIAAAKRKLESEFNQLGADLDEMSNEARLSEDKAARAMVDAARLADELRCEQDVAMNLEKDKKLLGPAAVQEDLVDRLPRPELPRQRLHGHHPPRSMQALVLQGQLLDVQEDGAAEKTRTDKRLRKAGEETEGVEGGGAEQEEGRVEAEGGADQEAGEEQDQVDQEQ